MNVLVTGANGKVGRAVVAALQAAGHEYERNLGPDVRDPGPSSGFWSYVDVHDLAELIRLAVESDVPGHEVVYAASPDNSTGRPLAELVRRHYGDRIPLRPLAREDASGISCAKARGCWGGGRPAPGATISTSAADCARSTTESAKLF